MKIGITLGLRKEKESMWINGIKLNAIFLQNALTHAGHEVILLDTNGKVPHDKKTGRVNSDALVWDDEKFPMYDYAKCANSCDILVLLGVAIGEEGIKSFKATGTNKKVIKYACGNNYVLDMEAMIFKEKAEDVGVTFNREIDEVWYVPQQGHQNHEYYRVTNRLPADKVMPVPFVWDPMFIDAVENLYGPTFDDNGNEVSSVKEIPVYRPGKKIEDKQLGIFEPNLNVVKFSMLPTLIAEDYLLRGGEVFNKLNVISAGRLYKNEYWKKFVQKLKVVEQKNKAGQPLLAVQHRYPIHYLLSQFADVVISHQWANPLNYVYLDILYLQFPLVHNADMIQDAGYYYPEFEIDKGADQLEKALHEHDANMDAYNERTEEVLTRYTVYNEELVENYKKLIDNLMAGENKHGLSLKYNWKTNGYHG